MDECNDVWNSAKILMINELVNLILLAQSWDMYVVKEDVACSLYIYASLMNESVKKKMVKVYF